MSCSVDGGTGRPRTLLEALRAHAARAPEALFCRFVREGIEHEIGFGDLVAQAERYARLLRSHGVRPGALVLIVAPHDPVLLHAFIGAMIAGAVPAFLPPPTEKQDPEFFWRGMERMTEHLTVAAWIIGTDDDVARLTALGPGTACVLRPRDAHALPEAAVEWHAPAPDATAFLQFSSGTTGIRKGVMLTHAQVLRQIEALTTTLRLTQEDRIVSWLPLYHDMGLIACFLLPWVAGVPVVWMSPFEWVRYPQRLFELIERHRGTLTWMPNFAFRHLCATVDQGRRHDLSRMRAFINCSEACKAETFEAFVDTFAHCGVTLAQLQTCYAMAEAVFAVTHSTLGEPVTQRAFALATAPTHTVARPDDAGDARRYLSVGHALPGFDVAVVDAQGNPCAEGQFGEVRLRGPCLSSGYYRNDDATQSAFRDGWYATGDIGFMHRGELYIAGRTKEIIIVHGRNCFAHDIEAVANTVEGIHGGRLVAIGVDSAQSDSEEVVLLVESAESDPTRLRGTTRALKDALALQLNLTPRVRYVPPRWLVKTTSGKIDRQSNKRKYLEEGTEHGQQHERRDVAHA